MGLCCNGVSWEAALQVWQPMRLQCSEGCRQAARELRQPRVPHYRCGSHLLHERLHRGCGSPQGSTAVMAAEGAALQPRQPGGCTVSVAE